MRYNRLSIFLGVLAGLLFFSCEEKPVTIPEFVLPDSGKNVLVEDLTGVKCPNCPAGASRLENISDQFSGRINIVGIHGIQQASPIEGESKYDFRNEFAIDIENYHKPFLGKPSAVINRVHFENEEYLGVTFINSWQSYIEDELLKEHVVDIVIAPTYNETNRTVTMDVAILPLKDLTGDFKLSIMIVESGMIDIQETSGGNVIHDYVHNHVLMDMMTLFDGDNLGNQLSGGELTKRTFQRTLPEKEGLFQSDRLSFVVFISDNSNGLKTVLQSVSSHL